MLQDQSLAHGDPPGVWYGGSLEWNNGYRTAQRCDLNDGVCGKNHDEPMVKMGWEDEGVIDIDIYYDF